MVPHVDPADISWAVVDSGLDFLQRAVEELADTSQTKYATIHLYSAIEVLIKARLIHEHWTLACAKADNATLAGLKAGNVVTVGAIEGLKRLKSIVGVSISDAQMKDVEAVRRQRNRVVHFVLVDDDEVATRTELARGLDFVVWFLQEHFQPGAPAAEASLISGVLSDLVEVLVGIKQFVAERLVRIQGALDVADLLLRCPACSQDTLDCSEEEEPRCLFCGWVSDGPGGADTYVVSVLGLSEYATVKDGGIWPIYTCPECSAQALVNGVEVKKNAQGGSPPYFLCFSCGYRAAGQDLTECSRCGELTQNEFGMCDDCIDYAVSRD